MLQRLFIGPALAVGIFSLAPATFAAVPDDETGAKAAPAMAAPAPAPAAESPAADAPIATPESEPAKSAPVKHVIKKPKPVQPATITPWEYWSRMFNGNATPARAAQWQMSFFAISYIPRTTVPFQSNYSAGTIVVNTGERRLYYVLDHGSAIRYGIGVGRPGFTWTGTRYVTAKREWPDWTPPEQMIQRKPELPRHMKGGPDNPLGARAMYLGDTLYRIHGTNEANTIGTAATSGCFRLTNDDVIDLYNRVKVGTMVVIKQN